MVNDARDTDVQQNYPAWTGDLLSQIPGARAPRHGSWPNIYEQMGTDPISKLAAAIEKLADALREGVRE